MNLLKVAKIVLHVSLIVVTSLTLKRELGL